jgi:hypothetical protein
MLAKEKGQEEMNLQTIDGVIRLGCIIFSQCVAYTCPRGCTPIDELLCQHDFPFMTRMKSRWFEHAMFPLSIRHNIQSSIVIGTSVAHTVTYESRDLLGSRLQMFTLMLWE